MNPIIVKAFKGRIPRVSAKLLPEGYAQVATNCDLRLGKLQPMKDLTTIKSIASGTRSLMRLSRDVGVGGTGAWISFTSDVDIVRAQIANSNNRVYLTGRGSYPEQTNSALYAAGQYKRLGVIAPTTALAISLTGAPVYGTTEIGSFTGCETSGDNQIALPSAHGLTLDVGDLVEITAATTQADIGSYVLESFDDTHLFINQELTGSDSDVAITITRQEDAAVADSVSYVYTRVVKWADGSEEESAPSDPTAVTDVYDGQGAELTGFVAGSYNDVTHFRIYRLASGTSGAEYQYLDEIIASETSYTDDVYDGVDYETHALQNVGADILETEDWLPPPDALEGLTQFSNGILVGFVGNKLYVCEPWVGYAWPTAYSLTFDYDIVALGVFNESIMVLTEAFPYVVTGLDPESMSQTILPYEQACVSKAGVAVTNIGVVYPTPDGLFLLNGSSGKMLTKDVFTKDQWAALGPENLISFFYDDQYYGFFRGTGTGFLFNFKENPYIVDISIGGGSITGGFLDPEDDTLYLVNGASLKSWGTSASYLTYTWKSAIVRPGEAANYACAAVVADGSVDFQLYADGTEKLSPAKTVTSEEMFRLPSGYRAREWEFSLTGTEDVDSVAIGQHSGELY